jgi:hypothetical protein
VGELKSAPNDERDGGLSAPELAQRALDRELNSDPEARQRQDLLMNDLTSMVVKRKAPVAVPEASGAAEKRKAEDGEAQTSQNKKARLEESPAPWPPPWLNEVDRTEWLTLRIDPELVDELSCNLRPDVGDLPQARELLPELHELTISLITAFVSFVDALQNASPQAPVALHKYEGLHLVA